MNKDLVECADFGRSCQSRVQGVRFWAPGTGTPTADAPAKVMVKSVYYAKASETKEKAKVKGY